MAGKLSGVSLIISNSIKQQDVSMKEEEEACTTFLAILSPALRQQVFLTKKLKVLSSHPAFLILRYKFAHTEYSVCHKHTSTYTHIHIYRLGLTSFGKGDNFSLFAVLGLEASVRLVVDQHAAVLGHAAHMDLADGIEQGSTGHWVCDVGPILQVQHTEDVPLHRLHHILLRFLLLQ